MSIPPKLLISVELFSQNTSYSFIAGIFTLDSVERFDIISHVWETIAPMQLKRSDLGCALFDNYLYAVGGRYDFQLDRTFAK